MEDRDKLPHGFRENIGTWFPSNAGTVYGTMYSDISNPVSESNAISLYGYFDSPTVEEPLGDSQLAAEVISPKWTYFIENTRKPDGALLVINERSGVEIPYGIAENSLLLTNKYRVQGMPEIDETEKIAVLHLWKFGN